MITIAITMIVIGAVFGFDHVQKWRRHRRLMRPVESDLGEFVPPETEYQRQERLRIAAFRS